MGGMDIEFEGVPAGDLAGLIVESIRNALANIDEVRDINAFV